MAIIITAVVLIGFARTYLSAVMSGTSAVPWIIHVHAVVFTSWLLLFIVQTTLVGRDNVALHRTLGTYGMGLAALMLIVGVAAAVTIARMDHRGIPGVEFPDAGGFLLLNLLAIAVFSVLVAAGWIYRKQPQTHKRLMLMASASSLVGPGVARWPFLSGNTPAIALAVIAFLLAGPVYDLLTRRRIHPAYIAGTVLGFLSGPPIAAAISASAAWHGIAAWLMR